MSYFLLAAVIILIPYSFLPESICGALLAIVGSVYLLKSKEELKVNRYIVYSMLLLNGIAVISLVFCKNINLFFDGFFVYLTVLIFYLVFISLDNIKLYNALVYIIGISACIFIIFQGLVLKKRVDGNLAYANTYGLVLLICLYVNELKSRDKFYSIIQWIAILGILFTESRGTFIYLIIFVILDYIIELKRKKEPRVVINFCTAVLLYILYKYLGFGIVFVLPVFYISLYYIYDKLSLKIKMRVSIISIGILIVWLSTLFFTNAGLNIRISSINFTSGSLQERIIYYEDALKYIIKNPLGSGINSFVYNQYKSQSAFYDVKYIHNSFLQVCYDLGVLGLAAFVFIFLYGVYLILKFEEELKVIKIALLLTIYLHSLLDFDFSFSTIFIIVIMIISSLHRSRDFKLKASLKLALAGFGILVSVYVLVINSFLLLGDIYAKKDMNKSIYLYQINKKIAIKNPDVYVSIAQVYRENNMLKDCLNNLKLAEQINPEESRIRLNIAFTYEKLGDVYNTIKYYDLVLKDEKYYSEIYKKYYLYLQEIYQSTNGQIYKTKMEDLEKLYYANFHTINRKSVFLKNQLNENFEDIIKK